MLALVKVLVMAALAVVRDRASLVAENILLRQQIATLRPRIKRPRVRPVDRCILSFLTDRFRSLVSTIIVVAPRR